MRRAAGLALAFLALVVLSMVLREREGTRALALCDAARARADVVEAITMARAAAEARCPLLCPSEEGFVRLESIARDAEARGDYGAAFAAWNAARAAILATRILEGKERVHIEEEIARVGHRLDVGGGGRMPSAAANEDRLRMALAEDVPPSPITLLLLAIGAVAFLAGVLRLIRALDATAVSLALAGVAVATVGAVFF